MNQGPYLLDLRAIESISTDDFRFTKKGLGRPRCRFHFRRQNGAAGTFDLARECSATENSGISGKSRKSQPAFRTPASGDRENLANETL